MVIKKKANTIYKEKKLYLYKRNITYKDVKPSNIMISKDKKNVKFIDVIGIF